MFKFSSGKALWGRFALLIAIIGPGIITGSVDNDAGGITTYSVAGAVYGYNLIWTLIPAFIVLLVIQEMNARMGIVTGKGLADLIRENAGVKVTFFIFIGLLIADIGNTTTEFAGVAGSMEVFGISKYISVPVVAFMVWLLVVKGTYKIAERIFLIFSVSLLTYVVSAIMGKPHWGEIGTAIIHPQMEVNSTSLAMMIGIIGTTIAPWMQFYMQSSVIEKGLKMKNFKYTMIDIVIGCVATIAVAFFIMIACASTLHENGIQINEAKDAALALKPLAGEFAGQVFAFGLFIASVFSATILPLATAFYVCEAFGFEAGIDKKWEEAPEFYVLYTAILVISAGIILWPNVPLIAISIWSQVLNGLLLPVVLVCMILLVNNKKIMGEYTNKPINNIIGWGAVSILIVLTVLMLVLPFFSKKQPNVGLDNWYNHETNVKTGKPYHYLWTDTTWSGYSRWGKIFTVKGAAISTLQRPNAKLLSDIKVYILVDPDTTSENSKPNYIVKEDANAIEAWVRQGGVLMILANDAPNCEFTHLNQLSSRFGIVFNHVTLHPVSKNNWEMGACTNLPDHPIFKGVQKIYLKEISSLTLTEAAKAILTENGQVLMAESRVGKGLVVAMGDPWIYNEYIDHDRLPESFDNRKAANNLTDYLLKNAVDK